MATIKKTTTICRGANSSLLKCDGLKPSTEFYNSWSIWDNEKTCYCKTCLEKIFKYYVERYKSNRTALFYTCALVNIPFRAELFNSLAKNNASITFSKYYNLLHRNKANKDLWNDFSQSNDSVVFGESVENNSKTENSADLLRKKWGIQDSQLDYDFLEETFNRYTNNIDFVNQQQFDLYCDLCRDRLLLRKINDNRYNGEETIDKVQNRIAKTMGILKIDHFEAKKQDNIDMILERQIWEIENTEPAEMVDKNEYKDFLNIHSDWGKDILRCVKNLLVGSKEYPNIARENDKY